MIGRDPERDLLRSGLATARSGSGNVWLIAGEPGAGKTCLAGELASDARRAGVPTAWGRAVAEDGSPPYWPFRQMFRELARLGRLPVTAAHAFDDVPVDETGLNGPGQQRFYRFEAVTDALIAAADPDGLLVVLDDVHWADPGTLQMLVHLARSATSSRLMVVATYRDTETIDQGPLRAALADLGREPVVSRIGLTGWAIAEVAARLAEVTGWTVPDQVAEAVRARTGGNPFFVEELGRVLATSVDGRLPDGVRDAVRARLRRLSPLTCDVIAAASVVGTGADVTTLVAASEHPMPDVLAALDEATAAGIMTGSASCAFAHDLIREAALLDVSSADRLGVHRRVAQHLIDAEDAAGRTAEIAYHLVSALPIGSAEHARVWARRAGDAAMAQLAWEEAGSWYRRAADVRCGTPAERAELLLSLARAQIRAYDVDGARKSIAEVAAIGRTLGDSAIIGRAVLVMEGVTDFMWDRDGRALCEEALAGLPGGDSGLRARLLAQIVAAETWTSLELSARRSIEALEMAERVNDRRAIKEALRARQLVSGGPDGVHERMRLAERMIALGRDGDADAELWGLLWRFDALVQLGKINRAESELAPIVQVAERLNTPLAHWHALRVQAAIALARGRFADAFRLGEQAADLARRADHIGTLTPSIGFLFIARAQVGDVYVEIDKQVERGFAGMAAGFLRSVIAAWKLSIGARDEAYQMYRMIPPLETVRPFVLLSALGGTADLAAEFDDREMAAEVYRRLLPYADYFLCGGAGVVVVTGSARAALGIAAATLNRLDDAVAHLRAAIEVDERAGMPPMAAIARLHLARALARRRRPGDRDEAAALATAARAAALDLGMRPVIAAAGELLDALDGVRGGPLTRREQEIAAMVATGLTNRQIAAAAHISERTAESHVQHILTKLGFATRTQIATWASTHIRTRRP